MKYVILIHSNPQPWGHPTGDFVAENLALPPQQREQMQAEFEALLTELSENGELVSAEALGDPASSRLFRWSAGAALATDAPCSESKEHLAGFFLIDVEDRDRAKRWPGGSRARGMPSSCDRRCGPAARTIERRYAG